MSRRTKIAGTPESTENSEAGLLVDSPALLAPPSISGHITDSSMPRIAGGPFPRFSDPYAPPDPYCEGKPPHSFLGSLSRRRATKPLFAPPTAIQIGSISLVEQNRLFSSRKIKDVWNGQPSFLAIGYGVRTEILFSAPRITRRLIHLD